MLHVQCSKGLLLRYSTYVVTGVFIAVPFYVAANVKDTVTLKNCIYIGILMIISIALYGYYKRMAQRKLRYSSKQRNDIGQAKMNQ